MSTRRDYSRSVFVNCPFDRQYAPLFEAIVFTVQALGFRPRCARERLDSGDVRLSKISALIRGSRYSVHDLSRTQLDRKSKLPRFNMPLELGIDLGCRMFSPRRRDKCLLILDTDKYRYQKYISDIAGQDVQHHADEPYLAILQVRNWLRTASGLALRGGEQTYTLYEDFRQELPDICARLGITPSNLTFADFTYAVARWLKPRH